MLKNAVKTDKRAMFEEQKIKSKHIEQIYKNNTMKILGIDYYNKLKLKKYFNDKNRDKDEINNNTNSENNEEEIKNEKEKEKFKQIINKTGYKNLIPYQIRKIQDYEFISNLNEDALLFENLEKNLKNISNFTKKYLKNESKKELDKATELLKENPKKIEKYTQSNYQTDFFFENNSKSYENRFFSLDQNSDENHLPMK